MSTRRVGKRDNGHLQSEIVRLLRDLLIEVVLIEAQSYGYRLHNLNLKNVAGREEGILPSVERRREGRASIKQLITGQVKTPPSQDEPADAHHEGFELGKRLRPAVGVRRVLRSLNVVLPDFHGLLEICSEVN